MNSDDLLKEIQAIARDEDLEMGGVTATTYERLADGTLSKEERSLLESLAESDENALAALQAYSPLTDGVKETITDEIVDSIEGNSGVANNADASELTKSWIRRLTDLFSVRFEILVPALSLCAVVVFFVPMGPSGTELPQYALELNSSDKTLRSGEDIPGDLIPQFANGSLFDVILRPEQATSVEAQIRTYFLDNGNLREVALAPLRSNSGTFRIKATVGEQFPKRAGTHEFIAVVSADGAFPSIGELLVPASFADSNRSSTWQVFKTTFLRPGGEIVDGE